MIRTIDFNKPIPLFPLPNCVLLPHATIPLHIFEPRYRRMVSDAIDSRGLIAMACFEGDNWRENYMGRPDLRPCVCIGYVMRHKTLEDGRYNILLQGVARARIVEEIENDTYRLAQLEPLESADTMEIDLGESREHLEELLNDPLLKQLASVSAIHNWLSSEIPTTALIDLAIMTICDCLEDKYAMLAQPNVESRAHWLEHELRITRRTLAIAARYQPTDLPTGVTLN